MYNVFVSLPCLFVCLFAWLLACCLVAWLFGWFAWPGRVCLPARYFAVFCCLLACAGVCADAQMILLEDLAFTRAHQLMKLTHEGPMKVHFPVRDIFSRGQNGPLDSHWAARRLIHRKLNVKLALKKKTTRGYQGGQLKPTQRRRPRTCYLKRL